MENQHRKITGYRELTPQEVKLMNEIKALGPIIETVIIKVQNHVNSQMQAAMAAPSGETKQGELDRIDEATPSRFAALAKTDFQTALMYLTRAVAQPTSF